MRIWRLISEMTAPSVMMPMVLAAAVAALGQPAKGANKFLGNTTAGAQVRPDFGTYWNQIMAENATDWTVVEAARDQMNWSGADRVADYAESAGILWKFHSLVWGNALPGALSGLSQAERLAEFEEWLDEASKRYPDVPMIDVVNEGHPQHGSLSIRYALFGNGGSDYDWIFQVFRMARERWPRAILIYNDYFNIEYGKEVDWTVSLAQAALAAQVPIDAIGCEAHGTYKLDNATVKANLDKLAATGLPLFITEYDIPSGDDSVQLNIMKDQFPVFWNHPSVVGITYYGYVVGKTWIPGTGLITDAGEERPALTWLKGYVKDNPDPLNRFPDFLGRVSTSLSPKPFRKAMGGASMKKGLRIFDLNGREISKGFGTARERPAGALVPFPGP